MVGKRHGFEQQCCVVVVAIKSLEPGGQIELSGPLPFACGATERMRRVLKDLQS